MYINKYMYVQQPPAASLAIILSKYVYLPIHLVRKAINQTSRKERKRDWPGPPVTPVRNYPVPGGCKRSLNQGKKNWRLLTKHVSF